MRTGKSLIGLAVVGQSDGTKLGHVRDLIFDHDTNRVLALVLGDKDLFGLIDAQIVPWHEVRNVGNDVVLVESCHSKIRLQDDRQVHGISNRETVLSGTQIYTVEGQNLGTLADMCLDVENGDVLGYQVSGGFIADTLHGKKFLPASPGLSVGKDAAIVPAEAASQLEPAGQ